MRKKTSTTRLPQSLREEIHGGVLSVENGDASHYHIARPNARMNRKDTRKQDRASRKQKKAEYFSHSHVSASQKRPAEDRAEGPLKKKARLEKRPMKSMGKDPHANELLGDVKRNLVSQENPPLPHQTTSLKSFEKPLLSTSKNVSRKRSVPDLALPQSRAQQEEDLYIEYLEKQLGYKKGKQSKARVEEDDGLDDLLNWADSLSFLPSKEYDMSHGREEDDTDLAALEDQFETESDPSDSESDSSHNSEFEEEEEWGGVSPDEDMEPADPGAEDKRGEPPPVAAYVPPHLRKALGGEKISEAMVKLTRQLKGLLNRMSEQNIAGIVDSIEEIYRHHRRNDVTATLTTLIIDGISSHSSLLDSYVVLYSALVSSLHKLVGTEFAAHFVQQAISSYEKHYASFSPSPGGPGPETDDLGKECSNLIVLVSELYNFQVISCVLVFDIIRSLLGSDLTEFDVELLLRILRNSGQQLRVDDPLALKDIVQIVQDKVGSSSVAVSSRTRFMIETLTNLKNNKLKKSGEQNQGGAAVERLKKFLAGPSKTRHVLAHEPLRISLEDLHSAETKGKWWLVGAAWGGDPLVDRQANITEIVESHKHAREEESSLLKLARSQGMNSDIRRGIFVVLMSSEDYIDACDRLSQLNLTEVQQREIIRVLLHCCGNEKTYNPYYALICQHLCQRSHSYKITVQFCLWDFLRDLGEAKVGGVALLKNTGDDDGFGVKTISSMRMRNVARCYAWWIAKDAVSLTILKPVDFTILKPQTKEFLKELFIQLLINSQWSTPVVSNDFGTLSMARDRGAIEAIFIKASRVDTLAMGIVYFLTEAFRVLHVEKDQLSKFLTWAIGVAKDTLQTGLDVIPTL